LAALSIVACGGGGGGDDAPAPPAPPPLQVSDARFSEDIVEGLGFSVATVAEGKTDATGTFKVAQGRRVDFFVGEGANRAIVGTANPVLNGNAVVPFSLNDLNEVKGANGEQVLGNLVSFLAALDKNGDISDGVQI